MADDELSAPLGRKAKAAPRRFKLPTRYLPHVIAVALGLFVCAFAGWALVVNDPIGGEPVAMVATGLGATEACDARRGVGQSGAGPAQL